MSKWKANSVRIALNAQVFLDVNFGIFSASGSSGSPEWVGTTATAASTGTTITVASTTGFIGTNSGSGPTYLVDLSSGSTVPAGTQILTVSGNTITVSKACTIKNGDVISIVKAADTPGKIRETLQTAIAYCREYGLYIIWDLHWTAPQFTCPVAGTSTQMTAYCGANGQPPFMDAGAGELFWTDPTQSFPAWLLANYGPNSSNYNSKYGSTGIGDMIFELFNEPYVDFDNASQGGTFTKLGGGSCNAEYAMLNGAYSNAYLLQYNQPSHGAGIPNGGNYGGILTSQWKLLGYQTAVTGIRALGCTNIIQCNPPGYAATVTSMSAVGLPTDSLSPPQISVGWHPYEQGTSGFPAGGNKTQITAVAALIAGTTFGRSVPVIITEFGDNSGETSGPSAPAVDTYVASIQTFVDTQPVGSIGCHCFQWTGPLKAGATGLWAELTAGPNVSFAAAISGTTMTVTGASAGSIEVGLSQVGGSPGIPGTFVVSQTSGTPGGNGVYQISNTQGSGTYNWSMLTPCQGQGETIYNWMVSHA
jgi:hypothetical protein